MPRKQTTTEKLMAASGGKTPQSAPASSSDFIKKMLFHPDPKQAAIMVQLYAQALFMQGEGAELEQLQTLKKETDEQLKTSSKTLTDLENAKLKTPRYIKVRELTKSPSDNVSTKSNGFWGWELSDQLTGGFLFISLCIVMVMSGANIYSNLMASGEVVFIEQPWLAICIAALAPCASASFKMMSSFFEYQSTKKKYALCVHALTLLITLAWTVSFALNFTGVGGGLDLDAMLDGDGGKGAALVWLQLVCEILVAASLFLALGEIAIKYSPFILTENPDHSNISKSLKSHKDDHDKLCEKSAELGKDIARLEAGKEIFINDHIAELNATVSRFNSINQL